MDKRKYISEESINSRTDGKGKSFAQYIHGENTRVMFVDRNQGPDSYNGEKFNRIIFSIDFNDLGLSITSKFKDSGKDGLLVQYALDLMENDTFEEYYKVALLLTKERLAGSVKSTDELLIKFEKGEYAYPITKKNVSSYRTSNEKYRVAINSIDVTRKDLKFFAQYELEGTNHNEDRFDY
jgi:hypothetical protein